MSRGPKKSVVFQYFRLNSDESYFLCQVVKEGEQCDVKISSHAGKHGSNTPSRASNLKRHLQNKHPDLFKLVQEHDKEIHKSEKTTIGSSSSKVEQVSVTKYFPSEKITVSITVSKKFKQHLIELVVKNGVAIILFSSQASRRLNSEMATKLGISLERHSIRKIVFEEAEIQKTLLKNILHNKFFFHKMDACTRQRINYLAINVQFIGDEKNLTVRTLAVRDTEAQHSSDYIKKLIETVLIEYNVTKEQILTIVTDNTSNMTSAVEKLNEDDEEEEDAFENPNDEDLFNIDETIDTAISDFVGFSNSSISHMRCAVHTLQLAIRDGLKERNVANFIGRLRNIAIAARTPKLDAILKRRAGKGAILDQVTRWGSTYEMIQHLLELQPYPTDMVNPDVTMTDIQWQEASELGKLLKLPYVVTKNFQVTGLTPGFFYKEWKNISYKLTQTGGIVAEGIRRSMQQREVNLMNNNVLLAAIYVDPMHRILLTKEQIERGKSALCDIAVRIKMANEKDFQDSDSESCSPTINQGSPSTSEGEMDFDKYLDHEEKSKRRRLSEDEKKRPLSLKRTETPVIKFRQEFIIALKKVEKFDRKSKLDVKSAIPKYPEIVQNAAMTVTALPPTQVSVERLFSALRLIKSHLRANLKEDIMEAILFLRTNSP